MWLTILTYLTDLALGIVSQIKTHGANLPAEILADIEAGLAALTRVRGSLVTLQQVESLRTKETWPDPPPPTEIPKAADFIKTLLESIPPKPDVETGPVNQGPGGTGVPATQEVGAPPSNGNPTPS